jgi:DNA-binding ferritin-like protein
MDKILNLDAFGKIIEPHKVSISSTPRTGNEKSHECSVVFSKILQNIVQTKLLHWQSKMYGQHKALDKLFEGIIDLGDNLAESIMGKYGRPILSQDELCLKIMNYDTSENGDLSKFMSHLYKCYSDDCRSIFDPIKDSEIINILDEIVALIDKTKYLLSLR